MKDMIYTIWLSLCCTPGSRTFSKLLDSFDSAQEIFAADEHAIRRCVGSRSSDYSKLINKDLDRANGIYNFCTTKGVGLLSYWDDKFPYQLKTISSPPVLLYYRGILPDFEKGFRCAVVGTRSLSVSGRQNAFKLGYDLACAGATVVSGMATGIDGVAHAGALSAQGTTIAVLGSGIDVCYPSQHITLARAIVKQGCIITEYAPGTKPDGNNFPRRNRIISGLCRATVVVEGKEKSGALITARYAKEQQRDLFAFPGNVNDENSQLGNLLLKNGANLCVSADDIVRFYEKEVPPPMNPFKLEQRISVNIMDALRTYSVCATAPGDDIFKVFKGGRASDLPPADTPKPAAPTPEQVQQNEASVFSFDKESLKIYKKIPLEDSCTIDSLVDSEYNVRLVTKILMKLEMGRFITILPGDRVKRNTK